MSGDPLALVKLVREIAKSEVPQEFGDGIAAAVEGNYCSVRKGDPEAAATAGFFVVPGLNIIVGDHVLYRDAAGFRVVLAVLNRDVLTPYPNGGGNAGHDPVTVGPGLDVTSGQLVSLDLSEVTAGGELSGTLDAPTVDASHSGSTHAATQAAAEATAASALTAHTGDTAGAHAASAISFTPNGSIAATDVQAAIQEVRDEAGGGGAPSTVDYLVGTADAGLSSEIVVGTTPGGELGGTWASPTVDTTHSGSSHAGVITTHEGLADPHTGYRLESADHSHASTGLQGGTIAHSATTGQTATDHHVAPAAGPDADVTVDAAGAAGTASTFARSGHGHKLATSASAAAAVSTAGAAGTSGHAPSRDDHVHAHEAAHLVHDTGWAAKGDLIVGTANDTAGILTAGTNDQILMAESAEVTGLKWVSSQTPSTQAYSDAAAEGTADTFARGDHKHGMPAAGGGTTIANDTIWAAKGDIVGATANDTAAVLTVGANDTILMADSAAANGLKWVASASPSAVGTAAATGTADTFTRGDHVHAHEAQHIDHDTLWAAKGDIVGGTANDTAAVLTVGANDTILMADSAQTTGLKWVASATPSTQAFGDAAAVGTADTFTRGDHKHAMPTALAALVAVSGTSFPGSPATNDLYFRTDIGEWFQYNGTRWLCANSHFYPMAQPFNAANGLNPYSTTGNIVALQPPPFNTSGTRRDVWIVGWTVTSSVAATNDGSNYWTVALKRYESATTIASFVTSGDGNVGTQTIHTNAIGALLGTTDGRLDIEVAKTGSPGAIYAPGVVEFRHVAT